MFCWIELASFSDDKIRKNYSTKEKDIHKKPDLKEGRA